MHPTKQKIKSAFDSASSSYDNAAFLQEEVGSRMLERLKFFKITPSTILDLGSGTGTLNKKMKGQFPGVVTVEIDISQTMLTQARKKQRLKFWPFSEIGNQICGDIENIPIKASSIDFVWSSFVLEWVESIPKVFGNINNVLRKGGLFVFATLGPDTLKELRVCGEKEGYLSVVNDFPDMHDLGDQLIKAGLTDPVVDVEMFTLSFSTFKKFINELKLSGSVRKSSDTPPQSPWFSIERRYQDFRNPKGEWPATFEVIYGHAWASGSRQRSKYPVFDIQEQKF